MKNNSRARLTVAIAAVLLSASVSAGTFVYTNSPCVYLLVSNGVSQSATLLGPTGAFSGSVTVPVYVKSSLFSVTSVAPGAFKACEGLTAFALDASSKVSSIGAGAFWGCTNLTSLTLRASVAELGDSAFLGCSALAAADLSVATGLSAVAEQAFSGCSSLASVSLPNSVTRVGASAFRNCAALASVSLPAGAVAIGDAAFQGCGKLAAATFAGVTNLGVNAFAEAGLASVALPAGLGSVAQGAFANCTNLALVSYAGSPDAVGSAAFKNCAALTALPVSASVTRIASTAFDGCAGLTSVTLPSGVGDLSDNLFENCASLASVGVGPAVTNVGERAFACCPSLTNVTSLGNAPEADGDAFAGSETVFVYYYKGAAGWKNLLARRPTVMLGADGSVEALSFAAWAVRSGLAAAGDLSDAELTSVFAAASPSVAGLANGAVYAFGNNLTAGDQASLLQIYLSGGTPVVEAPALAGGAGSFVACTVEGTSDLASGSWDLPVEGVSLPDVTRAGYTPSAAGGAIPAAAFFRLRLTLN